MSLFTGILQSQAPPKQDATSTIQTLCLRLSTSTLLEDRRAAIQGLRSFAREYKETVASGGLRGLIGTLSKDAEDVDTIKVVLETLLLLFVKDESNPESSEDIALWLTDEFTQKQENITVLIDLLQDNDFYIRLYTLQLLVAILNNRPSRTQECVLTAPLGISRLVSTLDDKRDAIRNEGILLIINLSSGHTDIQKLIAFENAFEKAFSIIESEGGIDGGIVAQDCLQLLSNLLSYNASNQSYFRETGCVPKLAKLFELDQRDVAPYAKEQRDTNVQYAIRVVRLFVVPGGLGTAANQMSFFNAGILHLMLVIAFSAFSDFPTRSEALKAVADLVHENDVLQENFAQMKVTYLDPTISPEVQAQQYNPDDMCYVIEGLLDLALLTSSPHAFDARLAACRCLESYFAGNQPVRLHFLKHAINLHIQGDNSANILTCLINPDFHSRGDPYRVWLASTIFLHLIYDDEEAKALATSVKEGDAEAGEEVVTAIQGISANLVAALEHNYDPRIIVGYLMLLCVWLYEDSPAVDDFLTEGSSIQSLVSAVKQSSNSNVLVQGLCAFFLGILYEFSHKESPIPRATLHPILASRMGRDHYLNKVTTLRENPKVRDFEVFKESPKNKRGQGLPDVFFDHTFIDFLKDNYSRILRAIDKDPSETHTGINGKTNGISAELMESLKAQLEEKEEELSKLQTACLSLEQRITQEQHEVQRTKESAVTEMQRQRETTETLRRKYEADAAERNRAAVAEIQRVRWEAEQAARENTGLKRQMGELEADTKRIIAGLEGSVDKTKREANVQLRIASEENQRAETAVQEANRRTGEAWARVQAAEAAMAAAEERTRAAVENLHAADEAVKAANATAKAAETRARISEESAKVSEETVKAAEETVRAANKKVAAAEDKAKAAEERAATAEDNVRAAEERVQTADTDRRTAEEKVRAIEEAVRLANEQAAAAQEKVKTAEGNARTVEGNSRMALEGLQEKLNVAQQATQAAVEKLKATEDQLKALEGKAKKADEEAKQAQAKVIEADGIIKKTEEKARNIGKEKDDVQTQLDDLFMVLADLEDKREKDKKRLKALGEDVSDDDDDNDDEDEDDE
ncbi:Vesicle-mediated ER to Golgi transport protein [Maublancomyces gigas]|uniref:Vesicle-mediated ER to Golgi transport protein n=1 Tax=Discina gigas TaxID=1032678 RepID=A0ABR3GN62_9PEZI